MGPIGVRLFSSVFILVGAAVLSVGVKTLLTANESKNWPTVDGKVISSTVDSKRGTKGATTYHAEVLYEFTVNGRKQSSNDIAFGSYSSSDPSHARSIVNRYPAGSPSDPAKAVLEVGISGQTYFVPAFGAFFFCAGLAFFVFAPAALQRQRAARALSREMISSEHPRA
jgi:hypothetical protein